MSFLKSHTALRPELYPGNDCRFQTFARSSRGSYFPFQQQNRMWRQIHHHVWNVCSRNCRFRVNSLYKVDAMVFLLAINRSNTSKWTIAALMVMTRGVLYHNKPNSIWLDVFVLHRCRSIFRNVFSRVLMISRGKMSLDYFPSHHVGRTNHSVQTPNSLSFSPITKRLSK